MTSTTLLFRKSILNKLLQPELAKARQDKEIRPYQSIRRRDRLLWDAIVVATDFLPQRAPARQRCWHVENDIWAIPQCPIDGVEVRWWDNRYNTYSGLSAKNRCAQVNQKCRETRRTNRQEKLGRPLTERTIYRDEVMSYTKRSWRIHKAKIENYHLRSREYHLDHIYSIEDGFRNRVSPEVVGSWVNFRIIPARENYEKHMKSDISLDELYARYENA